MKFALMLNKRDISHFHDNRMQVLQVLCKHVLNEVALNLNSSTLNFQLHEQLHIFHQEILDQYQYQQFHPHHYLSLKKILLYQLQQHAVHPHSHKLKLLH